MTETYEEKTETQKRIERTITNGLGYESRMLPRHENLQSAPIGLELHLEFLNIMKEYKQIRDAIPETEMVGIQKPMSAHHYLGLLANSIADAKGKDMDSVTLGDIVSDLSERTSVSDSPRAYYLGENPAETIRGINEAASRADEMILVLIKYCMGGTYDSDMDGTVDKPISMEVK